MAENRNIPDAGGLNEPVCIDANRVYDSCGDKDCLSDLPVYFTARGQALIDEAVSVRLREADVMDVVIDTEPVPFHRGFYAVDITYFFNVTLDVFSSPSTTPEAVSGVCISDKKVILYGSEGNVKVFSSESSSDDGDTLNNAASSMPVAQVQVAQPIALAASLRDKCSAHRLPKRIPSSVIRQIGGEVTDEGSSTVLATIGVFSIVQLMRSVQMLIPSYDYCVPEKSCTFSDDSPCEMFSRLEFPTEEFFPPNVGDSGDSGCGCGCDGDSEE